jgi:hypothetical protein
MICLLLRGLVLIIDNEDFSMLNRRTGSVVDANNLDILFSDLGTYLGTYLDTVLVLFSNIND